MLSINVIMTSLLMLSVFFHFFVQESPFTLCGRMKMQFSETAIYLFNFLPSFIRYPIEFIVTYLFKQRNPLTQIFFFILNVGLFSSYVLYGVDFYLPSPGIKDEFVYIGYLLFANSLLLFYYLSTESPGLINKANHLDLEEHYKNSWAYYMKEGSCVNCNLSRLPRAKHCYLCNHCVEKYDHHCTWADQCVGAKNYKYFLGYIFSATILCCYAFSLGCMMLHDNADRNGVLKTPTFVKPNGETIPNNMVNTTFYLAQLNPKFFLVMIVLFLLCIFLTYHSLYHVFLIFLGYTQNEYNKKSNYDSYLNIVSISLSQYLFEKSRIHLKEKDIKAIVLTAEDREKIRSFLFNPKESSLKKFDEEMLSKFVAYCEGHKKYKNPNYKSFGDTMNDIVNGE